MKIQKSKTTYPNGCANIITVEREREKTLILIHILLTSYNREIYIQG